MCLITCVLNFFSSSVFICATSLFLSLCSSSVQLLLSSPATPTHLHPSHQLSCFSSPCQPRLIHTFLFSLVFSSASMLLMPAWFLFLLISFVPSCVSWSFCTFYSHDNIFVLFSGNLFIFGASHVLSASRVKNLPETATETFRF